MREEAYIFFNRYSEPLRVLYDSYAWTVFSYAMNVSYNIMRRLSPWIGVIMAFTRLLVSSYPFNITIGKMSNSRFAVWSLLVSLLVSTLIESDSFGLHEVRADITYVPDKSTTYQTTRLVTTMTGCLVVTEVSTGLLGLSSVSSSALSDAAASAFLLIASVLNEIFLLSYSLNSMAHCFITWFLSSQYRSCAKNLFPCLKLFGRKAKTESVPMSFQSINNRLNGGFASVET
ncbi:hypothetical protein CAEBREN_05839 [Caenorhabditis brenneri]|uniref:Uncharacterized protein n=1 Tax=Caenorhabditis brenneri TaxID=135651 RepID=G0M9E8_CAEBE|nr:hypothetical protein CAEBREN_05839 [Caenorhabditis brenneri]